MYWYKIEAEDENNETRRWVGFSRDSPEKLIEKAARGEYIILNDLLYLSKGKACEWREWDDTVYPTIYLNPKTILSFMQFRADPRTLLFPVSKASDETED